jgi:hypothetical protein
MSSDNGEDEEELDARQANEEPNAFDRTFFPSDDGSDDGSDDYSDGE